MTIIASDEGESFRVLGGRADAGLVVLCDHASNALPAGYGTLGLAPAELERHIAYDIGAEGIARFVADAFGVPAVLSRWSRLLIDPNRGADDPTLIMRLSDGAIVPGNRHLDEAERRHRVARFYDPYHQAIERVLAACLAAGRPPAILSIHTFTEAWKGRPRPWHVGILWDRDERLARPLIDALAADHLLVVGDNEPYKGALEGDCLWQHATSRGLVNALVEVRQDLVRDARGEAEWGERLVAILDGMRDNPHLSLVPRLARRALAPTQSGAMTPWQAPATVAAPVAAQATEARLQTQMDARGEHADERSEKAPQAPPAGAATATERRETMP